MAGWTEEDKQKAVKLYQDGNPTPENSVELVKKIAEDLGQSANGVRMVLFQANVYVKKDGAASATPSSGGKSDAPKAARVSKEDQINKLREAIEAKGKTVDDEILSKLTGKAAAYFTDIL